MFKGTFDNGPKTIIGISVTSLVREALNLQETVSCLDSRCNPATIFGLTPADAIMIRNPGGRVWSALPDIVALDSRFPISQIVIVMHSDCGTSHLTEGLVHETIGRASRPNDSDSLRMTDDVVKYKISHGEQSVRDDLALLKMQPYLRKELVEGAIGFWLDTFSGLVTAV